MQCVSMLNVMHATLLHALPAAVTLQVYDFKVGDGHCVLSVPFKNATRVLLSIYTSDQVQQCVHGGLLIISSSRDCLLSWCGCNANQHMCCCCVHAHASPQVQLLDIADPAQAKLLQNLDLPPGTGPHATVLAGNERLLAVSTYYVKHDFGRGVAPPFTVDNEKGVRLYTVAEVGNSFKPHPSVPLINFSGLSPHKGIARPHGMAFKSVAV